MKKTFVILQLLISLLVVVWLFAKPYTTVLIAKSYTRSLSHLILEKEEFFSTLDEESKKNILKSYEKGIPYKKTTYFSDLKENFLEPKILALFGWAFFSFTISLLLLMNLKVAFCTWILPFLGLLTLFCPTPKKNLSSALFPSKEYVLETYSDQKKDGNLSSREKLLKGWQRYLVTEWAHQTPSSDKKEFDAQLEKGLFAFNVARLKWIEEGKNGASIFSGFYTPSSIWQSILFFLWNVTFAWIVTKRPKLSHVSKLS